MRYFLLLIVSLLIVSCQKTEGYGGLGTIKGKVYGKNYNSGGTLLAQDYLGDVRVYIAKHGETNYFDDARTSYDGSFTFKFLHPGTYDVWVFSDCDYCNWNQSVVLKTIEITKKKEIVELEDFVISL